MIWNARLTSAAGQALLGAGYGLLAFRSERQATKGLVGQAARIRG